MKKYYDYPNTSKKVITPKKGVNWELVCWLLLVILVLNFVIATYFLLFI